MSKFPHDDFAKAYLGELLQVIGNVRPNLPLKAETRTADLWFEPRSVTVAERQQLGLLGELLTKEALIEVFRDPVTAFNVRSCQGKLSSLEGDRLRQARRDKQNLREADVPDLWLIVPTASRRLRNGFSMVSTETPGVYQFPEFQRVGLIVVHQLPKTTHTIWLRILGRASLQKRAIGELVEQSPVPGLYANIEELLADYRSKLEPRRELSLEEEELLMNLSAAYLKKQQEWKEEGREEGREEGIQAGIARVAINLLHDGAALESVAKATGLSIELVTQLRDRN
jgi:hypothetical protein